MDNLESSLRTFSPAKRELLSKVLKKEGIELPQNTEITDSVNSIEVLLTNIWKEVLNLSTVNVDDNLFDIGGDSIIAFQIVTKCRRAGLKVIPRQILQYPTIRDLAHAISSTAEPPKWLSAVTESSSKQSPVAVVPLTPIQRWFFHQQFADQHHWNQSLLLKIQSDTNIDNLRKALDRVVMNHEAFRLRFHCRDSAWSVRISNTVHDISSGHFDLSMEREDERGSRMKAIATELQATLNLSEGPLFRAATFNLGEAGLRSLLVAHHLVVDTVSWRIFIEDTNQAYDQICKGQEPQLPAEVTSFKEWAGLLAQYQSTSELLAELPYWQQILQVGQTTLDIEHKPEEGKNCYCDTSSIFTRLANSETDALLRHVPQALGVHVQDVLLWALVKAFSTLSGRTSLLLDLENHGREAGLAEVDLSRTVGWFTSLYPMLLHLGNHNDLNEDVRLISEQLKGVPHSGIGFGLLKFSEHSAAAELRALPGSTVSFNYLGRFDQALFYPPITGLATESMGAIHAPHARRPYLVEVICGIFPPGQLEIAWMYNRSFYSDATINTLARAFQDELRYALALVEGDAFNTSQSMTMGDHPGLLSSILDQ